MSEEWRPVDGFEGIYDVSDQGRVRRHCGNWASKPSTPWLRPINPWPKGPQGHLAVGLSVGGVRTVRLVHRLVMAAFVGPCPEGQEVRHLDGNSSNNRLGNLAYGTHSDNELDKVRHGTHRNAGKTHCKHGHEFTAENTLTHGGGRRCRTCANRRRTKAWKVAS